MRAIRHWMVSETGTADGPFRRHREAERVADLYRRIYRAPEKFYRVESREQEIPETERSVPHAWSEHL